MDILVLRLFKLTCFKINFMNNRLIGFLLLLLLSLGACKEDNNTTLNILDINGTWKIISISSSGCIVGDNALDFDENGCANDGGQEVCIEGQITFNNGAYTEAFDFLFDGVINELLSGRDEGTYTIEGNEFTICSTGANCDIGTIKFENNTLIVTSDPSEGCVEITKLKKI